MEKNKSLFRCLLIIAAFLLLIWFFITNIKMIFLVVIIGFAVSFILNYNEKRKKLKK